MAGGLERRFRRLSSSHPRNCVILSDLPISNSATLALLLTHTVVFALRAGAWSEPAKNFFSFSSNTLRRFSKRWPGDWYAACFRFVQRKRPRT